MLIVNRVKGACSSRIRSLIYALKAINNPILTDKWFRNDRQFNAVYLIYVRQLAGMHWTPLNISRKVVQFLAVSNAVKVMDIGSGEGKFCLSGAYYKSDSFFYGLEQRYDLVKYAESAKKILNISNVSFIHGNFYSAQSEAI